MADLIESLRDVLTIKKLAIEVGLTDEERDRIKKVTDEYLKALLK